MFQAIAFSALAATAAAEYSAPNPQNLKLMFDQFKKNHGRAYKTMDEEMTRFSNFKNTLKTIHERNVAERKAGGSATHGINRFADLTHEEFSGRYLGYVKNENANATVADVKPYTGTDSLVDWTGVYTTPVKDQGYCGSCWAFAASEQIESDAMRQLGVTYTLSPQQLVECDRSSMGCNGGLQERAYSYVQRTGGIEEESNYPYTSGTDGSEGSCSADSSKYVLGVNGYSTIKDETSMASYVKSTGPVSIAIDASTWSTYTGGIMTTCGTSINHAVQAVGVDDSTGGYWKVRNSWSETWGESGFIRLAYGQDMCGITYDVTYVDAKKV
jgi:C1A family cysteine protease